MKGRLPKRRTVGVITERRARSEPTAPLSADNARWAAALRVQGVETVPVTYGSALPAGIDLLLPIQAWGYHQEPEADTVAAWLEATGVPILNPTSVLRWNTRKNEYLPALMARGIPLPETVFIEPGETRALLEIMESRGWAKAVVKPTVSASAHGAFLAEASPFSSAHAFEESFDRLRHRGAVLVQEFLPEVHSGELSFVYFAKPGASPEFSHAVIKIPAAGEWRVQEHHGGGVAPFHPPPGLRHWADDMAAKILPSGALYARLDVIETQHRGPVLGEAELYDPAIHVRHAVGAPERFADAVAAWLEVI